MSNKTPSILPLFVARLLEPLIDNLRSIQLDYAPIAARISQAATAQDPNEPSLIGIFSNSPEGGTEGDEELGADFYHGSSRFTQTDTGESFGAQSLRDMADEWGFHQENSQQSSRTVNSSENEKDKNDVETGQVQYAQPKDDSRQTQSSEPTSKTDDDSNSTDSAEETKVTTRTITDRRIHPEDNQRVPAQKPNPKPKLILEMQTLAELLEYLLPAAAEGKEEQIANRSRHPSESSNDTSTQPSPPPDLNDVKADSASTESTEEESPDTAALTVQQQQILRTTRFHSKIEPAQTRQEYPRAVSANTLRTRPGTVVPSNFYSTIQSRPVTSTAAQTRQAASIAKVPTVAEILRDFRERNKPSEMDRQWLFRQSSTAVHPIIPGLDSNTSQTPR